MAKLKAAVYSIMKGGENSAVASVRLARYVAETLKLPLHMGSSIQQEGKLDLMVVINGPMLYAMTGKSAPIFSHYMLKTKHLIWVQNDYTIYAPADAERSKATVGFRADFAKRKEPLHYWTTCESNVERTPGSAYVNWNALTYEPKPLPAPSEVRYRKAFYYGAYRHGRREEFARYLGKDTVVSSVSKGFFEDFGATTKILPAMPRAEFYPTLRSYACGLYLEDRRSHKEFHSPANRFYEMLGAGLPMLFQPEAKVQLAKADLDISPFTVADAKELHKILKSRDLRGMGKHQAKLWRRDYRKELDEQVRNAWRKTLKEIG